MSTRRYTVACLAGDGVGPEVMAEASLALQETGRQHGFSLDEQHVPFGSEALLRFGHPLPAATRRAYRAADAVLVAATTVPALDGVKADLDLTWRIQRVRVVETAGDLAIVSALTPEAEEHAVERAFELARSRRGSVVSVGCDDLVAGCADRHGGVDVEHLTLADALPILMHAPEHFDVVVCDTLFVEALSDMAAYGKGSRRVVATGRLSSRGPGIFGPTHGTALEIAGMGVVDPSGMLLAAALMLGEGLGERAAAQTLERAVRDALREVAEAHVVPTTREFTEVVLAELPRARTDTEFFTEVHAG